MSETVIEERSVGGYVSCIKMNGKPILPPLMTPERWAEMKRYKEMAVSIETTLRMKRNSVDSGVICPSSQSPSWGHRKTAEVTETTTSNNQPSTSDEEVLFELVQKYTSPIAVHDSKKHHESKMSTISNNAGKTKACGNENIQASHSAPRDLIPVEMNVSELHHVTKQCDMIAQELDKINHKPTDISKTILPPKGNIREGSLSHSQNENLLDQSLNVQNQEQNLQSEAKHISFKTTESVPPSSCPQDTLNFGTISPIHIPVVQIASPVAESATSAQYCGDEAGIPVKKIHPSLNISEIIARDDIIQDGLGFKVWKQGCEMLKRRPQLSSTPADLTEENLSTVEANKIENFDESVSSVAVTASTDLNNYMDTSSSSASSTSIPSLSSVAPIVHESEIVKQTTYGSRQSSSSDQSKHMQVETETRRSFSKSTPESQLQNHADNFGIDGIRPLDLENEVGQLITPGIGVIKTSTASEVKSLKKVKDHVKEKTADSVESNESRTSSDSPPPRLKRQHSYVLECPSPLLVEYLKSLKHDSDMTASPTKKTLSSLQNHERVQKRRFLSGSECNSSLPNSSITSPVKLQSPFASSECLSSTKENLSTSSFAVGKNMIRKSGSSSKENLRKLRCISSETVPRLSGEETLSYGKKNVQKTPLVPSPRCNSVDNISTAVSKKSTRIAMKCPNTPQKTPRTSSASMQNISPRSTVKHVACVSQGHPTESSVQEPTSSKTPEKLPAQEELRAVFLQLQLEHQQQMADLLEKQEREQTAMREAFHQQQIRLMNEIRTVCPEVFSTPESHKLLTKSFSQPHNTNAAFGLKGIDHDKKSPNNNSQEKVTGNLQENVRQKQENPEVDKNFVNKKMENDNESSRLYYRDDASCSGLQNMSTITSEVTAETFSSSNTNPSQEVCQNELNSSLASGHVDDFCNIDSSVHRNNAAQYTKENAIQQVQKRGSNVHNSTNTSDIIEAVARENMNLSREISSNKSDLSRSMTTESSSVEYSDSIVTSGASGNKVTQQMLYSVHTNGAVIGKMHHLDEISLSSIQNISTNTSNVADISKQVCRRRPSLSETTDHVRLANAAVTSGASDFDEDAAAQQALYGLQTDGKVVSSMLTVAKSEVILSDGLPYLEPTEGTVRTTVFTQLNGVDHDGLVNTHFNTVMHGARQSCSRELFPTRSRFGANYTIIHEIAAIRIQAFTRGYLTRRLFRTSRVQDLITTIRDTLLCAVQVSQECWPDVQPEDVALHRRLIQQVTAACYALHDVFFSLHISEQMAIIATDRERQRSHAPRTALPRPLSAATRRALERKLRHSESEGRSRTIRSRRTWSSGSENSSGSYGIARSCLLRQQQQQQQQHTSPPEQMIVRARYSNSGSGRRPWR